MCRLHTYRSLRRCVRVPHAIRRDTQGGETSPAAPSPHVTLYSDDRLDRGLASEPCQSPGRARLAARWRSLEHRFRRIQANLGNHLTAREGYATGK
jgi:hypothetical protein